MISDILLDSQADRRFGPVLETYYIERFVKNGSYAAKLESNPGRKLEYPKQAGRDHHRTTESERGGMLREAEFVRQGLGGEKVLRLWIEPPPGIRVYVQGRGKEEVDPFAKAARNHGLQVDRIVLREVPVSFHTSVKRQGDGRVLDLIQGMVACAELDRPAQTTLAYR